MDDLKGMAVEPPTPPPKVSFIDEATGKVFVNRRQRRVAMAMAKKKKR